MWHMFAHGRKCITNQRAAIIGFNYSEADFTLSEVHHLQCAWILNQSVNIIDNQLLWCDQMINRYSI
ncbi:Uncharacterised protein [Shigella sonnei]|nr:Uncharacterised protein [Shigella sonnei]SIY41470.1 Uncharacterised protein [Shigella sonnei]SIZ04531.1 Uncharacterised protein [Shigella sonnei]